MTTILLGEKVSIFGGSFYRSNTLRRTWQEYCDMLEVEYKEWLEEFKEVKDERVLWDLVKYKKRQRTIAYSKAKVRKSKENLHYLEDDLRRCARKCDNDPSKDDLKELGGFQEEYDQLYDFTTHGAIIRSRATWYELREKNNKYFLNLEQLNRKKSSVWKIFTDD